MGRRKDVSMEIQSALVYLYRSSGAVRQQVEAQGKEILYQAIFSDQHFIPRGVIWTPYYLISTWLYKRQILQGIRDTLQGLRKY